MMGDEEFRPPPDADRRNAVARKRLSVLAEVSRLTFEWVPNAEIAARIGRSVAAVEWMQQVLGWRLDQVGTMHRSLGAGGRVAGCTDQSSSSRRLDATAGTETV